MKTLIYDNSYPLTSPFGTRTLNGHTHFHDGVDFGTPTGTPLKAPKAGVVHTAGVVDNFNPESPNLGVLVRMDNGLFFTMFHMSRIDVRVGQRVEVGQVVGLSGNTGFTTGSHVHFGVYQQPWRLPVDPMPYITLPNQTIINPKNNMDESQIRFIQGNGGSPLSKERLVNAIVGGDTEYYDLHYHLWIEELKQEAINSIPQQVEELANYNIDLEKVDIKLADYNPIATKSQNSLQVEKDVNENAETFDVNKFTVGASKNGALYGVLGGIAGSVIMALSIAFPEYSEALTMLSTVLAGAGLIGGVSNGIRNVNK